MYVYMYRAEPDVVVFVSTSLLRALRSRCPLDLHHQMQYSELAATLLVSEPLPLRFKIVSF